MFHDSQKLTFFHGWDHCGRASKSASVDGFCDRKKPYFMRCTWDYSFHLKLWFLDLIMDTRSLNQLLICLSKDVAISEKNLYAWTINLNLV